MSKKKKPHDGFMSDKEFKRLNKKLLKGEPVIMPASESIVHCRDCKWRNTKGCFCKDPEHVRDNWSCSEGELAYQ